MTTDDLFSRTDKRASKETGLLVQRLRDAQTENWDLKALLQECLERMIVIAPDPEGRPDLRGRIRMALEGDDK